MGSRMVGSVSYAAGDRVRIILLSCSPPFLVCWRIESAVVAAVAAAEGQRVEHSALDWQL